MTVDVRHIGGKLPVTRTLDPHGAGALGGKKLQAQFCIKKFCPE